MDYDRIYYSDKRQDYIIAALLFMFAIPCSVAFYFICSDIASYFCRLTIDTVLSWRFWLDFLLIITIILLMIYIMHKLYLSISRNIFTKAEVVRLTQSGIIFTELKGRLELHKVIIPYSNISNVYLR